MKKVTNYIGLINTYNKDSIRKCDKTSKIADKLRIHRIPVWFRTTNVNGAQQWHDEIGNALKRCVWFIVLLSKNSVKSACVMIELMYAFNHSQYENHILPIIIEECEFEELSWTLEMFEMININNASKEEYKNLFKTWGIGYDANKLLRKNK